MLDASDMIVYWIGRCVIEYFSSTKKLNIKNHALPAIARLNKAKRSKVDNQVTISNRNNLPLSFS